MLVLFSILKYRVNIYINNVRLVLLAQATLQNVHFTQPTSSIRLLLNCFCNPHFRRCQRMIEKPGRCFFIVRTSTNGRTNS